MKILTNEELAAIRERYEGIEPLTLSDIVSLGISKIEAIAALIVQVNTRNIHLGQALQHIEALTIELGVAQAQAEGIRYRIIEGEDSGWDYCRYCNGKDYPIDENGNRLDQDDENMPEPQGWEYEHEDWCPSVIVSA